MLSYPLKSLKLHPSRADIFKRLATGEFICFDEILSRTVHSVPDKVEFFLDELVRKGFLERRGVGHLSTYPFVYLPSCNLLFKNGERKVSSITLPYGS